MVYQEVLTKCGNFIGKRNDHFVHIYFPYLQCKINDRLQRNSYVPDKPKHSKTVASVKRPWRSAVPANIRFVSVTVFVLGGNFKKFLITSPHAD